MNTPRLLVLRIWTSPEPFRAVVRELDSEQIEYFTDPEALCRFVLGVDALAHELGGRTEDD